MILHHLEQSRSLRIIWALEELGLEYDLKYYKRLPNFSAPPELKKVHPLGKAPVLSDGDLNIAESAVILDYLQSQYDTEQQFKPSEPQDVLQYNYWMHYAEGSLMPLLVMTLVMSKVSEQAPLLVKPIAKKIAQGVQAGFIQPRLSDHIAFLEQHFKQHDYVAGAFSFADIQMSFPILAMQQRLKGQYPAINAYAERLTQRPAYSRAKAKAEI
ncbi:glutathione S-transferase [Acinetobacter lanii]|uniref:glutathione transferase n=1 Tax=Acinetobacter lanii TaxID=2715163 RepID=A0A6G8S7I9_9GAMM|nr:glutathione S-transferase [Acinetobacter lanii]QIO10155.1 glutathione S-transferase [Acinetobacter lanii]